MLYDIIMESSKKWNLKIQNLGIILNQPGLFGEHMNVIYDHGIDQKV